MPVSSPTPVSASASTLPPPSPGPDAVLRIPDGVVAVADYVAHARRHLDDHAWHYLDGGAADEITLRRNRDAFERLALAPRVLADVAGGHTRLTLFGQPLAHPILLAPVAYQRLFHPDGESATLQAAMAMQAGMVVSTFSSVSLETLATCAGPAQGRTPLWFQLYIQPDRGFTRELVARAEAAGYQAIVITVDAPVSGIRNREQRSGFRLPPGIGAVNLAQLSVPAPAPLREGQSTVFDGLMAHAPTWRDIANLRTCTRLPILLKGVLSVADAGIAVQAGIDGLIVSNHGGRTLDTLPSSLDMLPRIIEHTRNTVPVLLDGGIQRGSDVFKALALGASAVLAGRAWAYALAVAGPLGVAHVLRILRDELEVTMALTGCRTLTDIQPDKLHR